MELAAPIESIITASDALKKLVTVDKEQGSFTITKFDLSEMLEERLSSTRERNLRRLVITPVHKVLAAIGKLEHLQELNLARTAIRRVPVEILLGCKHLKVLNLSCTDWFAQIRGRNRESF